MNREKPQDRWSRAALLPWLGAFAVHALAALLLLQAGTESAQSNLPPRPDVEAVRVQAADERLLQARRAAHRQLLREEELRKQREREAARERAAQREREREMRRKAEAAEKKKAEARRQAKEEAERKAREEAERRAKAEAERKRAQAALAEAEERAQARREAQEQRRQREAAQRARRANIWRILIKEKIERVWLQPPAVRVAPCEVVVEQDERGEVLSAEVRGCRASRAWQESLRNAVLKASPLPPPPDPGLFDRRLVITFHPKASR